MFAATSSLTRLVHRYEYHRIGDPSQCWFICFCFVDDVVVAYYFFIFLHFLSIDIAGVFGVRHLQTFLMFFGLTLAYALRVNMSVAIVAMTDRHAANPDFDVCVVYLLPIIRLNILTENDVFLSSCNCRNMTGMKKQRRWC